LLPKIYAVLKLTKYFLFMHFYFIENPPSNVYLEAPSDCSSATKTYLPHFSPTTFPSLSLSPTNYPSLLPSNSTYKPSNKPSKSTFEPSNKPSPTKPTKTPLISQTSHPSPNKPNNIHNNIPSNKPVPAISTSRSPTARKDPSLPTLRTDTKINAGLSTTTIKVYSENNCVSAIVKNKQVLICDI